MSETRASYKIGAAPSLDEFRDLACSLRYADPGYEPPTPEQVSGLIQAAGWSQNDVAKLVGVNYNPAKGSTTIRKWRAPAASPEHRDIPYSAWRLMLIYAGVVEK